MTDTDQRLQNLRTTAVTLSRLLEAHQEPARDRAGLKVAIDIVDAEKTRLEEDSDE